MADDYSTSKQQMHIELFDICLPYGIATIAVDRARMSSRRYRVKSIPALHSDTP